MNILVTLDQGYLKPLSVMLKSLAIAHPDTPLRIFVMNKALTARHFSQIEQAVAEPRLTLVDVKVDDALLADAPVTDRYPKEMYYRIFAAHYLPAGLDRILYLDPDLVVLHSLETLYATEMETSYFAAASHVRRTLEKLNGLRLKADPSGPYINSGVMLLNLSLLRSRQNLAEVFEYIRQNSAKLLLPDQDVISALYGEHILSIDPFYYNMTERLLWLAALESQPGPDFDWVQKNSCIIHYCGRNKPWKPHYIGKLDKFYFHYAAMLKPEIFP